MHCHRNPVTVTPLAAIATLRDMLGYSGDDDACEMAMALAWRRRMGVN